MSIQKSVVTEIEVAGCYECPFAKSFHGNSCVCIYYDKDASFNSQQFSKPSFCTVVFVAVKESTG